jgi:hypothetical protein
VAMEVHRVTFDLRFDEEAFEAAYRTLNPPIPNTHEEKAQIDRRFDGDQIELPY